MGSQCVLPTYLDKVQKTPWDLVNDNVSSLTSEGAETQKNVPIETVVQTGIGSDI